ncbi:MAG: exo-alpha-sialidase [Verrucomicrobiales bacterium]|nr:exo-alpha-sialidase [Verrucomicrobiales bacterium]
MKFHLVLASVLLWIGSALAGHWSLETESGLGLHGSAIVAPGVKGKSRMLDGGSLIELQGSASLGDVPFTASLWFNPYEIGGSQQMLMGKNRYARGERQWGLIIEPDGHLRAYLWQGRWVTLSSDKALQPGHWHRVTLVVSVGRAELYLNGKRSGEVPLAQPLSTTAASITLGGILDEGRLRQLFHGALDEVVIDSRAWSATEVAETFHPVAATHELPKSKRIDFPLWDETAKLGEAKELPLLKGVEFHVIKRWDKPSDGYTFLHGVGLAWHKGRLYASIGHNRGAENTVTEEAQYRVSEDGGCTWGDLKVIDDGPEENLAVSHGVFLSHQGLLWAFHGAYRNHMEGIHTRAYRLDEATGAWEKMGIVVEQGFWAMNQPIPMTDGNWIMPGISAGPFSSEGTFPAAVAISHGNDFSRWDYVSIPVHPGMKMWGESAVVVEGSEVVSMARYGGKALALAAKSSDSGRTWSTMGESNLPMATSKPAAGRLSTGQRYLVGTTVANNGGKRSPLTIAVSEPGEDVFSMVFVIRHAEHTGPGESNPRAALSYPCATEHKGKLYVGFSNNGGRGGNLNSAELAVIPLESLK